MKYIVLQSSGGFLRLLRPFVKKYLQTIIIILCLDRVCCLCGGRDRVELNGNVHFVCNLLYEKKKPVC